MTARLRILVVLLSATLAQATVCSEFRIGGVGVELMLLVTILAGIHGGPERGALVAFWAGLLYDSIPTAPLGLHALGFPSVAMAVSSLERRMLRNTLVTDALAVAASVAIGSTAAATPRASVTSVFRSMRRSKLLTAMAIDGKTRAWRPSGAVVIES